LCARSRRDFPRCGPLLRAGAGSAVFIPRRGAPMASMTIIHDLERRQIETVAAQRRVPEFAPGDTVKVMVKVMEGTEADAKDKKKSAKPKEEDKGPGFRLQAYE